jgi:hypothetical protein
MFVYFDCTGVNCPLSLAEMSRCNSWEDAFSAGLAEKQIVVGFSANV